MPSHLHLKKIGAVAQLVAHLHGMQGVRGSNPLSSTIYLAEQCIAFSKLTRLTSVPVVVSEKIIGSCGFGSGIFPNRRRKSRSSLHE